MLSYIHIAARFSYCLSSVTTRMMANNYGLSFVQGDWWKNEERDFIFILFFLFFIYYSLNKSFINN